MNSRAKGMLFTLLSALLFGVTPVLASFTYDMGSNASTLTFYRNLMVVPVLLVVMLIRKIPFKITAKEALLLVIVGVLFRASTTFMLYDSYPYLGIGTATTLHFLYPVCTALLCRLVFREKLGRGKVLALCLATAGIAFFCDPSSGLGLMGVLLATASALTYSCYMAGMDKTSLKEMNPNKVACYMGFTNAMAILLLDLPQKKIVFDLPPKAMLYTFIIAICTSFGAVALLQLGIKELGASTAAIFCMFEPIASVLSGWLFLHEAMPLSKIIGCAVILGAVTIIVIADSRKAQKTVFQPAASDA